MVIIQMTRKVVNKESEILNGKSVEILDLKRKALSQKKLCTKKRRKMFLTMVRFFISMKLYYFKESYPIKGGKIKHATYRQEKRVKRK